MGDRPWGTHFCNFYESRKDLLDMLLSYFKAGLEDNEFCVWVVPEPVSEREAWDGLRAAVPDFDDYAWSNDRSSFSFHADMTRFESKVPPFMYQTIPLNLDVFPPTGNRSWSRVLGHPSHIQKNHLIHFASPQTAIGSSVPISDEWILFPRSVNPVIHDSILETAGQGSGFCKARHHRSRIGQTGTQTRQTPTSLGSRRPDRTGTC